MAISMYQASVPVFKKSLTALKEVLAKGAAHAVEHKIDESVFLGSRLYPNMFPLTRQVQIAADFGKGPVARLSGNEPPKFDDNETTFAELAARIDKTLAFIDTFTPAQIDGSEDREIVLTIGGKPTTFKGQQYLLHMALPNLFFHMSMSYAILRHNGVDVGKRDFIGGY
jgi:uncharacterized protein